MKRRPNHWTGKSATNVAVCPPDSALHYFSSPVWPSSPGFAGPDLHSLTTLPRAQNKIRTLRFVDQPDGSIQVIDASTGANVHNFQGEQGFVRGTLRALVRDRRLQGFGADQPFELIAHDAGRLSLRDPATGSTIALESFGSKNIGVFARLMR
jgi:putative photosynthetic complex assembly protein